MPRSDRKRQILEAFVIMLQTNPGARITTAALAKQVGVSEAALYRHFPSKAKMIDALLEFAEDSVFSRIKLVLEEESNVQQRCHKILYLLLSFVEKNPGFARLLVGDALQGETDRLRLRVRQFFDRIETQLRQIIREHQATMLERPQMSAKDAANLMLCCAEGRISQFVRSEFREPPAAAWNQHWSVLRQSLLR
jgi:TetR/AcrR family transcriptional regulator